MILRILTDNSLLAPAQCSPNMNGGGVECVTRCALTWYNWRWWLVEGTLCYVAKGKGKVRTS
jgi:hypothetical protein